MSSIGTRPAPCTDYRIINMLLKVKDDEFIDDIERAQSNPDQSSRARPPAPENQTSANNKLNPGEVLTPPPCCTPPPPSRNTRLAAVVNRDESRGWAVRFGPTTFIS